MIRAELYRGAGNTWQGFRMKGHADYDEHGSDIVCAAVSVLSITCINSLEALCGVVPETACDEDGFLEAYLPDKMTESQKHDAQLLLGSMIQGLTDLAESYPDHLNIVNKERRSSK